MNLLKTNKDNCLICLKNYVFFECNELIFEFSGPTYKDCYQQFIKQPTDELDTKMLCLECGNGLRGAYQLAGKVSAKVNCQTNENKCCICLEENIFYDGTEAIFEFFGPSYQDCYFYYMPTQEQENDCKQMFCLDCGNALRSIHQLVEQARKNVKICSELALKEPLINYTKVIKVSEDNNFNSSYTDIDLNSSNPQQQIDETLSEFLILANQKDVEVTRNDTNDLVINNKTEKNKTATTTANNSKETRKPFMCSYCSKIFYSRNHFTKHEETHMERERTEACPICGLKFYTAKCVKNHLTVHDENRVRKFKCEYCPKAFYSCGGLNCHRRKHLDDWWQCPLCPKKYCRQYELNRHIRSHEAVPVTKDEWEARKITQPNLFKGCKICGEKVNKYNWESHNAKHLNQPIVKCSICNKSYFSRLTLCRHLQKHHGVDKKEYEKYIIRLNNKFKPRHSSLMKKQNIVID